MNNITEESSKNTLHKHTPINFKVLFLLGFISMLLPIAVDMYLSAMPSMAKFFNTDDGHIQLTLSSYIFGFTIGQVMYGPLSDSIGRRPVIIYGILLFTILSISCGFANTIEQLIILRFLHGLTAAAPGVVINALMRDKFEKHEFSRMMSFVMLISNVAPLLAPLIGGWILILFNWNAIFIVIGLLGMIALVMATLNIKETLLPEKRQPFQFKPILRNFMVIINNRPALCFMLTSACSFSGMFAFISAGPFVYMEIFGVKEANFGYYFGLNIIFMMIMNLCNTKLVKRLGILTMFRFGVITQFVISLVLVLTTWFELPFVVFALCVSVFVGCIAIVSANAMALIMDRFPHIAGTASSLAGTFRFGIAALTSLLLSTLHFYSAWPMVIMMASCLLFAFIFSVIATVKTH